jgi:predicted RecB family nuclease
MRILERKVILSPTDLGNFLTCRHRAGLDLAVANGKVTRPTYDDPYAAMLREHGETHELAYVESLRTGGKCVVNLKDAKDDAEKTREAMRAGVDVIAQARLEGEAFAGYADILLRVDKPSDLGNWSYEVHDTKLARETKGGTILQLSAYSEMVARIQGPKPELFHVVTPIASEQYRTEDYSAYYRMVLATLRAELAKGADALIDEYYPEPVEACDVCVWEARCVGRRRKDDHLSFIANSGRSNRVELIAQGYGTLTAVAEMPVPVTFKPARGSRETYYRIGNQARVQHQQRTEKKPIVEPLDIQEGEGLCRLPPPSKGDIFLDLEGARFAREGGREFLFGVWERRGTYRAFWAMDDAQERVAFEAVTDLIMQAWSADSGMHVYHFNHYEPTAFKKLMGRYVTRGEQLDRLLRAERFVDLYPISRQAVRAGVESYSIKKLEQYSGYVRKIDLPNVNQPMLAIEQALDSNSPDAISTETRAVVQGYNEDDCRSTEFLRDWLERLRDEWEAAGTKVPRPEDKTAEAEKPVPEVQQQAIALRERLLATIPAEASDPAQADHPKWLLAYLIDWHRREVNAEWWEYFRLRDLQEDELLDEGDAVAGLQFVEQVEVVLSKKGKPTGSLVHRYSYPQQDIEVKRRLKRMDGTDFGEIVHHDRQRRLLDIKRGPKTAALPHPTYAFSADVIGIDGLQKSVMRLAERVLAQAPHEGVPYDCGAELLFGRAPRLSKDRFEIASGESEQEFAIRIATLLDRTTLAIQGPPGAGKTYIGAQMILALVSAGKKVGVTATSHKVIRNLLDEVLSQAGKTGQPVKIGAKPGEMSDTPGPIVEFDDNPPAIAGITSGEVQVLGGTAYMWAREEFAQAVDVLFVDEAGQVSLANVLAVSQAADSMVLLGDPQQLNQPTKASHPEGVGISALEHVLGKHETMPPDRGIFLPITWRMSPTLTGFTSTLFYEGKLLSKPGLEVQQLVGTSAYDGSDLWLLPVDHDGNTSSSIEEVDAVESLIKSLLAPGTGWVGEDGQCKHLTGQDFRVVAPFNAQVNRLSERLAALDVPVGTVDKFQGQTCAVVIYSMATSRPEDAPRGMEFLYSLNRLNVATSRARCAVFIVASPRLLEPECRTPRQMHLANALCRYKELSTTIRLESAR